MIDSDTVILIFSKAPEPGLVKTRLIPVLGELRAAEVYCELITKTIDVVVNTGEPTIHIWTTPDITNPFLCAIAEKFNAEIMLQAGENLGDRMLNAIQHVYTKFNEVIVIGCDCPVLSTTDLITAVKNLRAGADIVLGPSDDGGYYLLGCKEPYAELFTGIDWGHNTVLSDTTTKINNLRLRCEFLDEKWDVDTAEDLLRYDALSCRSSDLI